MNRIDGRENNQLRPVKITTGFVDYAEGSVLIECGHTKVLCCASVEQGAPRHVPEGTGWVTAEYSMLPRANRERSRRDVSKLKLFLMALAEQCLKLGNWTKVSAFAKIFAENVAVSYTHLMDEEGRLIELQGTGEGRSFTIEEQQELVRLCAGGIETLIAKQKEILGRCV